MPTLKLTSCLMCLAITILLGLSAAGRVEAETIADSIADWSTTGMQGESGWFNGYRNFTIDGGGDYSVDQFIPFDFDTHWRGDSWRLVESNAPWTTLGQEDAHPNGTNSAPMEEHWVIRRWEASIAEPQELELRTNLRAANLNGPGTSIELYQNRALLNSYANASGNDVTQSIYATINPGDVIDLALTPVSMDGDRTDGSDGSAFSLVVTNDPPPIPALADSFSDWSTTGTQGERNWYNGYYNRTQDTDDTYQPSDFTAYTNSAGPDGGEVAPDGNHWSGTQWDLSSTGAPWTFTGDMGTHPNGANSGDEHWTIRRYEANDVTEPTPVALHWQTAKSNGNGDGVTGILMINGQQVDSATIAGSDTAGVDRVFYANINPGDRVDLALTPMGLTNSDDGSDGSTNRLTLRTDLPDGPLYNAGTLLADSASEFSETQGQDNWSYGYYDQRSDVEERNGAYDVDDFIAFLNDGSGVVSSDTEVGGWKDSSNHWDGSKWDLLDNGAAGFGPWTEVTSTGGHPAANGQTDPEVQWAVRRWESDVDGFVRISGALNNGGGGDGTVGRIFVDGEEVWSELSDGASIDFALDLDLSSGSVIDFAIDPDGAGVFDPSNPDSLNSISDGSDGTTFAFSIQELVPFEPVPEPAGGVLLIMGLLGVAAQRRRAR